MRAKAMRGGRARMREKLRDKTRDNLADALNALGVGAEIAERGRSEERAGASWAQSLGVIDVAEGPVRWVNVVRQSNQYGSRWWLGARRFRKTPPTCGDAGRRSNSTPSGQSRFP